MAAPNISYDDLLKQGQASSMAPPPQVSPQQVAQVTAQSQPTEAERLNTYAYGHPGGPGAMMQATPTPGAPGTGTPEGKIQWKNFLARPEVKAGFLQMGINLLANQGFGSSIGAGAAAMGRAYGTTSDREAAEAAAAAKAARGGSGGGSGSGKGERPDKLKNMTWKQFNDQLDDYLEASAGLAGDVAVLTPGERQQMWERAIDVEYRGGSAMSWVDVALKQGLPAAEQMYQATIAEMDGTAPPAANNEAAAPAIPAAAPNAEEDEASVWEKIRGLFD